MPRKIQPLMQAIPTYVAGVTFKNDNGTSRQAIIKKYCNIGDEVNLIPEPTNKHDPNAVKVCLQDGKQIGYLRDIVADIRARKKASKNGANHRAFINDIGYNRNEFNVGITIIEWNNGISEGDADEFFEEERELIDNTVESIDNEHQVETRNYLITFAIILGCLTVFMFVTLFLIVMLG